MPSEGLGIGIALAIIVCTSENKTKLIFGQAKWSQRQPSVLNIKGAAEFQIACKWQLDLLQGLCGILSLLPLSSY